MALCWLGKPVLAKGATELGAIHGRRRTFHEQIDLFVESGEAELGVIARGAKAASEAVNIDRELSRARLRPLRMQVANRSRGAVLAAFTLERHDDVVVVVFRVPVASDKGACITRVDLPVLIRLTNIATVIGDKRTLDKIDDAFTSKSEAGEEWVAVVPLGREKLVENLGVAQKCKSKDFIVDASNARLQEEDSETRFHVVDNMRLVVLFVVDAEPHKRTSDS